MGKELSNTQKRPTAWHSSTILQSQHFETLREEDQQEFMDSLVYVVKSRKPKPDRETLSQQSCGLRADSCIPNTREDQDMAIQYRESFRPDGTT